MGQPTLIEVKPGDPIPDSVGNSSWHETMHAPQSAMVEKILQPGCVDMDFLQEKHHHHYGRPWCLGKYIFEYVLSRGLRREDKLLDCGCGSGRVAVWAIPFLQECGYHGIDIHRRSLEALVTYEIPLHSLEPKKPRVLLNGHFAFDYFGVSFDWVLDCFVGFHLSQPSQLHSYYENIAKVLKTGGRLLCLPKPKLSVEEMDAMGLQFSLHEVQPCPMLQGHDYLAQNDWFEFVRSGAGR